MPARFCLLTAVVIAGGAAADEQDQPDAGLIEFLGEWAPGDLNSDEDVTTSDWLDVVDMTGPETLPDEGRDEANDGNRND